MSSPTYERVSDERPCEICGKPDWCGRRTDGSVSFCRRVLRDDGVEREDKNGEVYYLHRHTGAERVEQLSLPEEGEQVQRAAPEVLDRAYTALLAHLGLSDAHRDNLRARGLSDLAIARGGFATLPPGTAARHAAIEAVTAVVGDVDLCTVPGFFRREAGADLKLAGHPGLLVPERDTDGRIQALCIRLDNPSSPSEGSR